MLRKSENRTPVQVPLGTEVLGVFKTLQLAQRNILELIPEVATHLPILSGRTGVRWHMVMDPTAMRHILKDNVDNYPKSPTTKNILQPAIGEGLFLAEGSHWRWQRRAMAPVFSMRNIQNLTPFMTAAAQASVDRFADANGQPVDVFEEMITATFEVIADVCFSGAGEINRDGVHSAINSYIKQTAKLSVLDLIGAPGWIPRPGRIFKPNTLNNLKKVADQAISTRQVDGPKPVHDLLDLLLASADPDTQRTMTPEELRDNLLTFVIAGHETTALTLCWSLYLLAFDPSIQDRVRNEVRTVLNGRMASADDVKNLGYTKQVIEESLRLYSPAAFLSRKAIKADTLCGREVRAGDIIILPLYALHRHHLLWDNPHHFDPDRFAPGHKIDRYAYLPFVDGPRVCIGAQFAMSEAIIVLASLISRFEYSLVPGKDPKPTLVLTLRPANGIWLNVRPVDPAQARPVDPA